ncbi:MAG: recombinase family protein [Chloroflexi bacterium]|nr:recombinase family protein [Chloroflexota bacterium]
MQKALIYCRVSTEEQAEKGISLDTQEQYCRSFAERNGYEVAAVYRDEGRSATNLDRPALQAMLTVVQHDKAIQAVIVQETDRLARNTIDHLTIRALLQKENTNLISVAQPMLDDSPEGRMIDTILASVNQFQSDLNRRKTTRGMQERFSKGWLPGWAPLGYLNQRVNDKSIIVKDPSRWSLVRKTLKMYLTGNYSAFELAEILHKQGLTSRTGKRICNSIMTHTLRNPFYAGIVRWRGQERIGKHAAMITLAEHRRILQILDGHNLHACRRRKHRFLLGGFVFCNICGGKYTAEKHPLKGNVAYYHCNFNGKSGRDRVHTNKGQNVEVSRLERQVEERFKEIQFSDAFVRSMMARLSEIYRRQKKETEAKRRALLNRRMGIERKRGIAEEKLLSGVIPDEDFKRIRVKIDQQLFEIQRQLYELDNQDDYDIDLIREILKLARNIHKGYRSASYELKRHYLALFWDRFFVQDKKIVRAVSTPLLDDLVREAKVIIRSELCPNPKLYITLANREYMATVRERLAEIRLLSRLESRECLG